MSGDQLKARIEAALRGHESVRSMRALARTAHVQPNTLYSWFTDKTTPRTYELGRVAEVLGVPLTDLWAAYGGDPTPRTTEEHRVASLIEEAYRRGYRDGYRDGASDRADGEA